jgi:hypothetical protein
MLAFCGEPLAYVIDSVRSRARQKPGKNRLTGESACPTRLQIPRQFSGTDAFVRPLARPTDFFNAS